ncbi:MAG: hypothetical protein ACKVTZ_07690, partial [Bacteroidia bacterium]
VFHFHFNPLAAQTFWAKQMTKDLRRIDYKETYNYTDIYKVHLTYIVLENDSINEFRLNFTAEQNHQKPIVPYRLLITHHNTLADMQKVLKFFYDNEISVEERNALNQKTYLLHLKAPLPDGYLSLDFFEDRIVQYFAEKTEEQEKKIPLASFCYKASPNYEQKGDSQIFYFKEMQEFQIFHQLKKKVHPLSLELAVAKEAYFSLSFKVNEQNVGYHLWIKDNQTVADMQMRLRHLYDLGMNIQESNSKNEEIYLLYPRNQHIEQKYLDLIDEIGEKEG